MSRTRGFPENGDLAVCTVTSVKNFGAFVTLDEYDNKEGFIHVRDIATGWVKYIRDYIREGQKTVCKVLEVNSQKGHIDLSLKSVNDHQKRERIQQWKNENKAEKLFEIVAEKLGVSPDDAYDSFGNMLIEDCGTLYGAFESAVADPESFLSGYEGDWVHSFMEVAKDNIAPPAVQIDEVIEMTSPAPDGVERIRKALLAGMAETEDGNVKITSVGSPRYRVVVTSTDYKTAEEILKKVTNATVKSITKDGGEAAVKCESK